MGEHAEDYMELQMEAAAAELMRVAEQARRKERIARVKDALPTGICGWAIRWCSEHHVQARKDSRVVNWWPSRGTLMEDGRHLRRVFNAKDLLRSLGVGAGR